MNDNVDYTFTGVLKISNLMTGIGSQTSAHPYLNHYARKVDKWMKTWRNSFTYPKLG